MKGRLGGGGDRGGMTGGDNTGNGDEGGVKGGGGFDGGGGLTTGFLSPQSVQSWNTKHKVNSEPAPPSSHSPSLLVPQKSWHQSPLFAYHLAGLEGGV